MHESLDELTDIVIGCATRIHRKIGGAIMESVYEVVLAHTLAARGLSVRRQVPVPVTFEGILFNEGFRLDLLVEGTLVVEIKSVRALDAVHTKQVLTYLRLMDLRLGLILNFGAATLKDGIKRVVNDLPPDDSPLLRVNRPN